MQSLPARDFPPGGTPRGNPSLPVEATTTLTQRGCGIRYLRDGASIGTAKAGSDELFLLYSESYIPDEEEKGTRPAATFLQEVVSGTAGEGAAGAQQHGIRHEPSGRGSAARPNP